MGFNSAFKGLNCVPLLDALLYCVS